MAVWNLLRSNPRGSALGAVILVLAVGLGACSSDAPDSSGTSAAPSRSTIPDSMTIPRVLDTDDRFSTLRAALDSTGLDSVLASEGPYTLFAPPNEAFKALPPGTMEALMTERLDRLRTILAHHVVERRLTIEERSEALAVQAMSGDTISLRSTQAGVSVEGISVVDGDVAAANGLVHVVDRVLPPPAENGPP
ncbi:MAG: fasciclin domain-containing protein [Salinibacter sp.]|uniref:fasciclin domain-containing protein n=1 Tax=Salinibacter sp. TaxID=2065818 RepID=UPI0035D4C35E